MHQRICLRTLLLLGVLAISVSIWAQEGRGPDRKPGERRPQHVSSYLGDVLLRSDGVRVFAMVDTILDRSAPTDGLVDQWFILETAEPVMPPISAHLPGALLVHSSGTLRVTSAEHRYDFVLAGEERELPGQGTLATTVVGIGLSHIKAEATTVRMADHSGRGRVSTTCDACEVLDPDPDDGGSGGSACPSGGPGAIQCSARYSSNSGSVSCASGYYACCNAQPAAAYGRCVRE